MKFIFGNGVTMYVKIYEDVIGCKEVIALGLPKECTVVECLTRDRGAAGSSLTSVTALWSLSKTHLS